jgi:hypothetical protein
MAPNWTVQESEIESRQGNEFSLLHIVQTGSGAYPASHPMRTASSISMVKRLRLGREADQLPPTVTELKKRGSIHPLFPAPLWHSVLLFKHRDSFTLHMYNICVGVIFVIVLRQLRATITTTFISLNCFANRNTH